MLPPPAPPRAGEAGLPGTGQGESTMFTVYRWDAAADRWVPERTGMDQRTANRWAMQLETRGTAVRCIVRRERAA